MDKMTNGVCKNRIENKQDIDIILDLSFSECNKDLKFTARVNNKGVIEIYVDPCSCNNNA